MAKDNVANNEAMPKKDSICTSQISLFTKIFISMNSLNDIYHQGFPDIT